MNLKCFVLNCHKLHAADLEELLIFSVQSSLESACTLFWRTATVFADLVFAL